MTMVETKLIKIQRGRSSRELLIRDMGLALAEVLLEFKYLCSVAFKAGKLWLLLVNIAIVLLKEC